MLVSERSGTCADVRWTLFIDEEARIAVSPKKRSFLKFWGGEEIPRWIGFSLVVVYVGGLCLVGYSAIEQTRRTIVEQSGQSLVRSVEQLSAQLAGYEQDDLGSYQRALRLVGTRFLQCDQLRVIDRSGVVIASIQAEEIGKASGRHLEVGSREPTEVEIHELPEGASGEARRLFRAPIGSAEVTSRFLEGVAVPPAMELGVAAARNWTLTLILAAVGLFWGVYHRLRRHLRATNAIRENLVSHRDSLVQELSSLRVSDELGIVAECWNELIDIAEEFREEVERSTASSELAAVLGHGGGGDLAEALNAIGDGVLVVDGSERIVYVNSKMVHFLGIAEEESPESTLLGEAELSPLGKQIVETIGESRVGPGRYQVRSKLLNQEIDDSSYRFRIAPVMGRGSVAGIVMVTDVSQQIRADKAREEFVSQVTHELRTPLTNIRAYSETLSSGMFDDPKVIADCYNVITSETRRLSRLIEDMLSLSQLEVGTMLMAFDDVDLHRLLTETVQDLRGLAEEKTIDLQLSLPAKLPVIQADRDKLSVVMNNLLGNALKYTPEGGQVRVECRIDGEEACIDVADTGLGIDPSEHERVFERFQRSGDPEIRKVTGTGIGLTTAREIARCHGGDIELQSERGKGSTFSLHIPCEQSARAESGASRGG